MTTLPESKLKDTASAVIGKPVTVVSNLRNIDDMSYFEATTSDGSNYSCSLQVVFGISSSIKSATKGNAFLMSKPFQFQRF